MWPPYLYPAGLQGQPPAASMRPDIIFYVRIGILTLKNLHLDIHEGTLQFDLPIVPGRPPGSIAGELQEPSGKIKLPNIIFNVRNEILTLKIYI